ncbi:MAG: hypothetical protein SFU98_12755 [Leptospiraceae bacterium]|nr:hypothetical protein [Leptospiraceae bacterium]
MLLISNSLNAEIQKKGVPNVVSLPNTGSDYKFIDPDTDRVDPRYLLSPDEIKFIAEQEIVFEEAGYYKEESIAKTKDEFKEFVNFRIEDDYERLQYEDEIVLGIPHKAPVSSQEELKKVLQNLESFYSSFAEDSFKLNDENLIERVKNISFNLHLAKKLESYFEETSKERELTVKNTEYINYLRRRLIEELIKRGKR